MIARNVLAAGHHDLHECHAIAQLRVAYQGVAKRLQPMRYSLGVIQPVDAQNQLPIRQLRAQVFRLLRHLLGRRLLHELVVVDADREAADAHGAAAMLDRHHGALADGARTVEQGAHALQEIAPIAQRLGSDRVVFEQRMQQLETPRQLRVDIERRERNVQKKRRA